jgi:hypothetical protein
MSGMSDSTLVYRRIDGEGGRLLLYICRMQGGIAMLEVTQGHSTG